MWNYYKTVVINSDKTEEDKDMFFLQTNVDGKKLLNIWRNGQYDISKIGNEQAIYKTVGYKGTPSTIALTFSGLTAGTLYQLSFNVALEGKLLSDYATPEYAGFYKPILVNFKAAATNDGTAAAVKDALAVALPAEVSVAATSNVVTVTAKDAYVRFEGGKLEKFVAKDGLDCVGEYEDVAFTPNINNGKQPFATGTWIIENLRLPNTLNYRYFGSNDEMPIANEVYTQYTFDYVSDRPGLGGHSGVGQGITAVTTHTFYVAEAAKTAFEAVLNTAGLKTKLSVTKHSGTEAATTSEE